MSMFTPTQEQLKAIELASDYSVKILKILAFAGAGKTSTLKLIAESMPSKRGIYLAFNKAIVDDVKRKMPQNVEVKTFHGLAYNGVPRYITDKLKNGSRFTQKTYVDHVLQQYQVVDDFVVTGDRILTDEQKILRKNLGKPIDETVTVSIDTPKQFKILKMAMDKFLTSPEPEPSHELLFKTIPNALAIDLQDDYIKPIADMLHPVLCGLWNDYKSQNGYFQIPHDVYLKLYALGNPQIKKDFILFDEAQDADSLMLHILKGQNTKVILVGDPYQQLYEWRGAVNAMSQVQGEVCYLTQSFRFGATIATNANKLLSVLGNDKPLTGSNPINGTISTYDTLPPHINAIICRSNVGVVESALEYASLYPRKNIFIDITGDQTEMLDTLRAIDDLKKLSDNKKSTGLCKSHPIIKYFDDFEQLEQYVNDFPSDLAIAPIFKLYDNHGLSQVEHIITDFASDRRKHDHDVRIQTVHKSKGLEWDSVAFCEDFKGFYSKAEDESNPYHPFKSDSAIRAVYVAQTRAKQAMFNFTGEDDEPEQPTKSPPQTVLTDEKEVQNTKDDIKLEPMPDFEEDTTDLEIETSKVQNTKRKYTPRQPDKEKYRNERALQGIKRATENGTIGRPKAADDKQIAKIERLISSGDWTLQDIADLTKLSLSTIKRIKKTLPNIS